MKTQIITMLWCCFSIIGFSQSITELEYFYNTDPGFGNATSITANTNTGNLTQTASIPVGSLTGFNSLYFRAKDDSNVWSMYEKRTFYITDFTTSSGAANIAAAEYFFNSDPGFGSATAITVNANTGNLLQIVSIPVGGTLSGFNALYIRTQDDLGIWSLYEKRTFYITDFSLGSGATNIAAAEYFFNTDPGFSNGTALTVNANTGNLTQTFALPVGSLTGFNTLYIRTQDDLGTWSLYERKVFYVFSEEASAGATSITAAEYFFNTDPGFGNGTAISVNANTGLLNQTISVPTNTLEGFNNLYIRTQDDLGTWSLYEKKLFYVHPNQTMSPIVAAEYFYDTDPGFGNGTAATITPTGNANEFIIDLSTVDVTCDFHDFYIRLQNDRGEWSLYDYREDIEVYDNADPTIVVFPNISAELNASGQASITIADVDDGTFDDCELVSVVLNQAQFDYTCADLGANTVTVTATDAEAKVSTEDVTITVVDNINPVAVTKNITVQLDGTGNVSITPTQIENGSTDNCSVTGFSLDISSFTCANLGANTVMLTVSDSSGNTNTTSATVTVEDNVNPVAITKAYTAQLDATGNVTIIPDDVDNSSTDNCAITTKSLDISSFTCANLGANTVMLTVEDASGNTNIASATVTVVDSVNPVAITQNITIQLDGTGNVSITPAQIENNSTDNCAVTGYSLDISSFTCANLGTNTVMLTVSDSSGNTNTTSATVTVEDNINPVAITKAFTAQLDVTGNVTISPDDVDNSSTDNCAVTSKSLDVSSFTCANLGANTVMFTVEDANGNTNTASATVTVEDNVNPIVITKNITAQLDASGNTSITASQVENGSSDNCAIASSSLDITSFTCANLGANTVTLSVTDSNGNTGTSTAIVTVEDNINPNAIGQDISRDLAGNPSVTITASDVNNGSSDNCNYTLSIDVDTFTTEGVYPVVLTITDDAGNSAMVTVMVTIDNTIGIEEFEITPNNILLYPNPSQGNLFISTELIIDSIDIFDIDGRYIMRVNKPEKQINLNPISSGMYFLKFRIENSFVTKRIVKE